MITNHYGCTKRGVPLACLPHLEWYGDVIPIFRYPKSLQPRMRSGEAFEQVRKLVEWLCTHYGTLHGYTITWGVNNTSIYLICEYFFRIEWEAIEDPLQRTLSWGSPKITKHSRFSQHLPTPPPMPPEQVRLLEEYRRAVPPRNSEAHGWVVYLDYILGTMKG